MKAALRAVFPAVIAIWGAVVVFAAAIAAGERGALGFAALLIPHARW